MSHLGSNQVELSTPESWTLLRGAGVGCLAVVVDGHPDILPVNHMVDREAVVFRSAAGTKPYFIRIEADTITGRRFEVTGGARSHIPHVEAPVIRTTWKTSHGSHFALGQFGDDHWEP